MMISIAMMSVLAQASPLGVDPGRYIQLPKAPAPLVDPFEKAMQSRKARKAREVRQVKGSESVEQKPQQRDAMVPNRDVCRQDAQGETVCEERPVVDAMNCIAYQTPVAMLYECRVGDRTCIVTQSGGLSCK